MKKIRLDNECCWRLSLFFITFSVYIFTLSPTISIGDNSADLTTAAWFLGVPHPTGYPSLSIIGKFFSLILPLNSIAARMNILSSLFASGAVVFFYIILKKIIGEIEIAFASSLAFAFSLTFWSQALITEVHAFNALFFSAIIFFLLHWEETGHSKWLNLSFFLLGLSFTNHLIAISLIPATAYFVIVNTPKSIKRRELIRPATFYFCLGLLPYLYLPLRSWQNPPIDWGNPETLTNFFRHITGHQFRPKMGHVGGIIGKTAKFFLFLYKEFTPFLLPFILLGIYPATKKKNKAIVFLALILIVNLLISTSYNIVDITPYYIPALLILAILLGYGLNFLSLHISRPTYLFMLTGIAISPFLYNLTINARSQNNFAKKNGLNVLRSLPKDAILFTIDEDNSFPLCYLTLVEKRRPDVAVYERNGNFFGDIYYPIRYPHKELTSQEWSKSRQEIEKKIVQSSERPVFYDLNPKFDFPAQPFGVLYQLTRKDKPSKQRDFEQFLFDLEIKGYADKNTRGVLANYYLKKGRQLLAREKKAAAMEELKKAGEIAWDDDAIFYELGHSFFELGEYEKAIKNFNKSLQLSSWSFKAYYFLMESYFKIGQPEKAISVGNKAIKRFPDDPHILCELGALHYRQAGYAQAISMYTKAIELDKDYFLAHKSLGIVFYSRQMMDKALQEWEIALKIKPADDELKRYILMAQERKLK